MKLSRNFVSDYIDLDNLTIQQIAEDMTNVGNEYDSCGPLISATNLVVGKVLECKMHPDSDHLHCLKVDIGSEVLDIVCGAPNVREGINVIVAKAGAILPGGEIKKGVIRGCESNGMVCSKAELGLDSKFLKEEDKTGIHILSEDAISGSDPLEYMGLKDEVIDFELTSNRGDLLSVLGMAYELGAIYDKKVKELKPSYKEINKNIKDSFKVELKTEDCPYFLAKKVEDVTIKESPEFIKSRLISSGIRPINNVVDISNYVMLEVGQPLHYYDADRLGDTLIVRNAKENETLKTLDNQDRILSCEDIVIADKKEAIGLAGVMGGLSTEVEADTKNIIIESAIFNPVKIRRTSKKILRSEASNRFEKGLDANRSLLAIERSCELLEKYADAKIVSGLIEEGKIDKNPKKIEITKEKIESVLGIKIEEKEMISIFHKLGFVVEGKNPFMVTVPTRRLDIRIKEDLIEEIGRIHGMDKIKSKQPTLQVVKGSYNKEIRELKHKLASLGLNETMSYTLIPKSEVHKYTTDTFDEITLNDPMSEDRNTLRYSLLPSLKSIYDYNKARNNFNISIFEVGKSFYENNGYKEDLHFAILMSGEYNLGIQNEKVDFYIIKGILEEVLNYFGYEGRYSLKKEEVPNELHPNISATINVSGVTVGILGKLHPKEEKEDVYVMEVNVSKLLSMKTGAMKFKEISKYPSIQKDAAFILDNDITTKEVEEKIKKAGGKYLTKVTLFDYYKEIEKGKKSYAYKMTFQDANKTLEDEEVNEIFKKIIEEVEKTFKAKLRDK